MDSSQSRYRTVIEAVSLVLGPALMSIGDLMHPAESWDTAAQIAIIAEASSAWRWHAAHLLLFIGLLLFVPGLLALTRWVETRRPAAGFAARVLVVISIGALSAVFTFEVLLGLISHGDRATALTVLTTFQSQVMPALMPGLLAFFVGTGLAVATLASTAGPFRWPAIALGLGAALILGEIILAEVLLSQIGNILVFVAGIGFARLLLFDVVATGARMPEPQSSAG